MGEVFQGIVVFAIAVAPVVIALGLVYRRRVTRLDAAAMLVLWGLLIVGVEHVQFGLSQFGGSDIRFDHGEFHLQMLAAYGLVAFALVAVVVTPLIRRGNALGWYGLIVLLVIGVGAEVATAAVTAPHGVPQFQVGDTRGMFLWGYPVAWATALILSFGPVFRPKSGPAPSRQTPDA